MASLHLTLILFLVLVLSVSSTRTINTFSHTTIKLSKDLEVESSPPGHHLPVHKHSNTTSTKHQSVAYFLAHPLLIGSSISFSSGFVLGLIAFIFYRLTIKHCVKIDSNKEPTTQPTLFSPLIRSIDDLFFLCRETCPDLEVIGRGGCGEVYKAEILTGGQIITVAIKKILQPFLMDASHLCNEESKLLGRQMRQIKSEIETVGRMRHPHLVPLIAHVPRPEYHYLVYEFIINGSLHDVLRSKEAREKLTWPVRMKIARGVTAGLEYLHMVHRPRVIHRDLKPANILLDENFNARIADFGLAKVVPEAISGAISSVNVVGTLGYIAPEYYQTLSCTAKSDIYSFGVILAVLITGRFPTDEFFTMTDEMCLVAWVRKMALSEDPRVAIDPALLGTGCEEEMILVLKIACFCTYDDPNERPNSKEINRMLSQIKK